MGNLEDHTEKAIEALEMNSEDLDREEASKKEQSNNKDVLIDEL